MYDRKFHLRLNAGRSMGGVRPKHSQKNPLRFDPCDFNTRNQIDQDSGGICRRARALFFPHLRHHPDPMRKKPALSWLETVKAKHRRAEQAKAAAALARPTPPPPPGAVTHLVRRQRADLPPATTTAIFSAPPIIQPSRTMTQALKITTTAATIEATAKAAGPFFSSALSQLLGSASLGEISTLSFQHNGVTHTVLAAIVSPFLNGLSAVRDMPRSVMISAQEGNADHLEKLTAAVRRALVDRDPVAASRAIKGLGSPSGWPTEVTGV